MCACKRTQKSPLHRSQLLSLLTDWTVEFWTPLRICVLRFFELHTLVNRKSRGAVSLALCSMVSIVSHLEQLSYQQQQHHGQITHHHQVYHRQKPNSLRWSQQQQQLPSPLPSPPQEQPPQAPHARLPIPPGVQYVHVGPYVIQASQQGDVKDIDHRCVDSRTGRTLACHVYDLKTFHSKAHLLLADLEGVHPVLDVQIAGENAFVISNPTHGDLHQHLRQKRRLSETQAAPLFQQLVRLVCKAHARGIALRDIKLKKIVFEDQER